MADSCRTGSWVSSSRYVIVATAKVKRAWFRVNNPLKTDIRHYSMPRDELCDEGPGQQHAAVNLWMPSLLADGVARQYRAWAQVDVNWDGGRKLMLVVPPDVVEIVAGPG